MEIEYQDVPSSGYVVDTLICALYNFIKNDSFEKGLLRTVNLGDDVDTTGCVYGHIAGCYYEEIPPDWVESVHMKVDFKEKLDIIKSKYK